MKNLLEKFRNWRYRRLYRKLFWFFLERSDYPAQALSLTEEAFLYLTGKSCDDVFNSGY